MWLEAVKPSGRRPRHHGDPPRGDWAQLLAATGELAWLSWGRRTQAELVGGGAGSRDHVPHTTLGSKTLTTEREGQSHQSCTQAQRGSGSALGDTAGMTQPETGSWAGRMGTVRATEGA